MSDVSCYTLLSPYEATFEGYTFDGADPTADYQIVEPGVGGLGMPDTQDSDMDFGGDHGGVAGQDWYAPRTLTIPVGIHRSQNGPAAMAAARPLRGLWRPRHADAQLRIRIAGYGPEDDTLRFFGRPRGPIDERHDKLSQGILILRLRFSALDPIGFGTLETASIPSTVTNAGDAPSRRAVVMLTPNGGTPTLRNLDDARRFVTFAQAVPAGGQWMLDLRTRTLMDNTGQVRQGFIDPKSPWFVLQPGPNRIEVSGVGSATVNFRSGWW